MFNEFTLIYMAVSLVVAAGLAFIPARIAKSKGRSFGLWWFYGWMLFIVALVHALLLPRDDSMAQAHELATGAGRKCPHCAEIIKVEAEVCRFCGREVPKMTDEELASAMATARQRKAVPPWLAYLLAMVVYFAAFVLVSAALVWLPVDTVGGVVASAIGALTAAFVVTRRAPDAQFGWLVPAVLPAVIPLAVSVFRGGDWATLLNIATPLSVVAAVAGCFAGRYLARTVVRSRPDTA